MSSGRASSSSNSSNNNRDGRSGQQPPQTSHGPQRPTNSYRVGDRSGTVLAIVMEWEGDDLQAILEFGQVRQPRSNASDPVQYVQGCRAPQIFANPNNLPLMINAIRPDGSVVPTGTSMTFGSNRLEISARLRLYKLVVEVAPESPHTARSSYLVRGWTRPEDIVRSIQVRAPPR